MFNYPIGSGNAPMKMAKAPKMNPSEQDEMRMGDDGEEPEDGAEIAEQHGPATEVHVQHEHEAGMHHVRSVHPDGHEHHSDHESAEAAHEHARKLAGAGQDKDESEDY